MALRYHQETFDLLGMPPALSESARLRVEELERAGGLRWPGAVREWYSLEEEARSVCPPLSYPPWLGKSLLGKTRWADLMARKLLPGGGDRADGSYYVDLGGADDPPVVVDESYRYDEATKRGRVVRWVREADSFSDFLFDWIGGYYFRDWTPLSETHSPNGMTIGPAGEKPYLNGLWLYAPSAEVLLRPSAETGKATPDCSPPSVGVPGVTTPS